MLEMEKLNTHQLCSHVFWWNLLVHHTEDNIGVTKTVIVSIMTAGDIPILTRTCGFVFEVDRNNIHQWKQIFCNNITIEKKTTDSEWWKLKRDLLNNKLYTIWYIFFGTCHRGSKEEKMGRSLWSASGAFLGRILFEDVIMMNNLAVNGDATLVVETAKIVFTLFVKMLDIHLFL